MVLWGPFLGTAAVTTELRGQEERKHVDISAKAMIFQRRRGARSAGVGGDGSKKQAWGKVGRI